MPLNSEVLKPRFKKNCQSWTGLVDSSELGLLFDQLFANFLNIFCVHSHGRFYQKQALRAPAMHGVSK